MFGEPATVDVVETRAKAKKIKGTCNNEIS